MNLTDQEILELTELCNALVDGRSTDVQQTRLAEQLAASEAARQFYVRMNGARWPASGHPVSLTRVLTGLRKSLVRAF